MDRASSQSQQHLKPSANSLRGPLSLQRIRGELPDRELEAGARAHYEDPAFYGTTYKGRVADIAYYVDLAKQYAAGKAVLEIGIGSGRIALPIARHGIRVEGIDASKEMLGAFEQRLLAEPPEVRKRIELHRGDMRETTIGKKFPLVVCTFNTALHLFTRPDVEAFLACVREHLTPRGRFVVDLSTPQPYDLARNPEQWHGAPPFKHPRAGRVRYKERFEYDAIRQVLFVAMKFTPVDPATKQPDESKEWIEPLAHRQFFPAEWEALLHYNGFEAIDVHGDYAGGPLDNQSDVMIWHAQLRASAKGDSKRIQPPRGRRAKR